MPSWIPGQDTSDPAKRFDNENSPFIVKGGELWEFRPTQALKFLQHAGIQPAELLIVLAGLTAWMVAPNGTINTKNLKLSKMSAQTFIHQAMVLKASEALASCFKAARYYQLLDGDWTNEGLLAQGPLVDFCFDMLFALGGFDALVRVYSVHEFQQRLENQWVPVSHVSEIVAVLKKQAQLDPRSNCGLEKAAKIVSEELAKPFPKNKVPTGLSASTVKGHWYSLSQAAPFIYAARDIDDGKFLKVLFRDPSLDHSGGYDQDLRGWLDRWITGADEVAAMLIKLKLLNIWPPPSQIFRGPQPSLSQGLV